MSQNQQLYFPNGIPGFEEYLDFSLHQDSESPLAQLISRKDEHVGFALVRPEVFFPNYLEELEKLIPSEAGETLSWAPDFRVDVWVVVSVNQQNPLGTTVNLRAPILINENKAQGMQFILNDETFLTRQLLFEHVVNAEEEGGKTDAGTSPEAERED